MTEWKPLLTGALADRAVEGARGIADSVARLRTKEELAPSYGTDVVASLASGAAGLAVAFGYLGRAGVVRDGEERAASFLEIAAATMAETAMEADLYGGYSGVAWAHELLSRASGEADEDDALSDVDEEVLAVLSDPSFAGPNDLVWGLTGIGLYAVERLPRAAARRSLARIVEILSSRVETGPVVTWRTSPDHLSDYQRQIAPQGHYDLGVAHGIPGIVGLLAQVSAAGFLDRGGKDLLRGAVEGLFLREQPGPSRYPYWVAPDGSRRAGRSAWCYGDPGVAGALFLAARCEGENAWERHALGLALHAAERSFEDPGVVDATLCHGAAGLGHIFNRLYQRTGHEKLRETATRWFERTLEMCRPGTGHGGYTTALRNDAGEPLFEADPSLLSGASGVALALAAAASSVEPDWDRMLLLSSRFEP